MFLDRFAQFGMMVGNQDFHTPPHAVLEDYEKRGPAVYSRRNPWNRKEINAEKSLNLTLSHVLSLASCVDLIAKFLTWERDLGSLAYQKPNLNNNSYSMCV